MGELELPNRLTIKFKYVYNLNGKDMYTVEDWQNGKLLCSTSHESRERILDYIADILATSEPLQSPETSQAVECTADTPKPRETAGKRQNRAIGSAHRSGLGANGYAMLDNASATLAAMSVPRECSTVEVAYW